MEPVSDRRRNPFGMRPPCEHGPAVPGYGDPAGDVHVIGDHPGRHGGNRTGIPFTGTPAGDRIQGVLTSLGLLGGTEGDRPDVHDLFMSYLHMCPPREGARPDGRSYQRLERYFDAELRAVNAHILVPVGRCPTDQVLGTYTTQLRNVPTSMDARHAIDVRGRGFLVVPSKDPVDWSDGDADRLRHRLGDLLATDYRQTKGVATRIG